MPDDEVTVSEIKEQVWAEQEYHKGDGLVPFLPGVTNPTLILTASEDITNPPSNQVRPPLTKLKDYSLAPASFTSCGMSNGGYHERCCGIC